MTYGPAAQIMEEIAVLTPIYGGISFDRLQTTGLQWPCLDRQHPGTKYLRADRFTRGKGRFHAVAFKSPAETPGEEFPFVLSTGRQLYQFHTGTMTRKSRMIHQVSPTGYVEVHAVPLLRRPGQCPDPGCARPRSQDSRIQGMRGTDKGGAMKETRTILRIAGAILTGGKAQRMGGVAKGMLSAGGSLSLVERLVVHLLRAGVEEIIIVANDDRRYTRIGCAVVPDARIDAGPLAGIEAALGYFASRYDAVLCLPCDMPSLSWREMSALIATSIDTGGPVIFAQTQDGARHPLCAVVRVDLLDGISAALDQGERVVSDLWFQLGGFTVGFDDSKAFVNLNSPSDFDAWLAGRPNDKAR